MKLKCFNAQKSVLQDEGNFLILDLVSKSSAPLVSGDECGQDVDVLTIFIGRNIEAATFVAISDFCESSQLYAVLRVLL